MHLCIKLKYLKNGHYQGFFLPRNGWKYVELHFLNRREKIPRTGDTESLDQCGYYHHCNEEEKNLEGESNFFWRVVIFFWSRSNIFLWVGSIFFLFYFFSATFLILFLRGLKKNCFSFLRSKKSRRGSNILFC